MACEPPVFLPLQAFSTADNHTPPAGITGVRMQLRPSTSGDEVPPSGSRDRLVPGLGYASRGIGGRSAFIWRGDCVQGCFAAPPRSAARRHRPSIAAIATEGIARRSSIKLFREVERDGAVLNLVTCMVSRFLIIFTDFAVCTTDEPVGAGAVGAGSRL